MVPSVENGNRITERNQLQNQLLATVKSCQTRFGGRTELATELDPCVANLCLAFEQVLCHGLKYNPQRDGDGRDGPLDKVSSALRQMTDLVTGTGEKFTLWDVVKGFLTTHEKERYELLRQIWNSRGRGRAWLRSAINERSLERYMTTLINSPVLKHFYEDWAFVLDPELSSILPTSAAGLSPILFALSIDRPELNMSTNTEDFSKSAIGDSETVIEEPQPGKKKEENKKTRKLAKTIISFGDEDTGETPRKSGISNINPPTIPITTVVHVDKDVSTCILPNQFLQMKEKESTLPIDIRHQRVSSTTSGPLRTSSSISTTSINHNKSKQEDDRTIEVECAVEATGVPYQDLLNSDNDSRNENGSLASNTAGLRLISNSTLGDLIPVSPGDENHSSEDSISVPSVSEENEIPNSGLTAESATPLEFNESDDRAELLKKLEKAQEINSMLKSQIDQNNMAARATEGRLDQKIQELIKENDSLKESLRKYVSAVQLLKQEGTNFEGDELYQQKLVQVAEMHGELMELNDRLQRNLVSKDLIIKRLYLELEALRGPLGPTEIDVSTQIISLWVPSVFLSGSQRQHHVYQIHVCIGPDEWNVYRRYSEFYNLHQESKKTYPIISAFQFPPKKTIGNKDSKFVEERRVKLQQYLRRLVNHLVANDPALSSSASKASLMASIPFFGESQESTARSSRPRPPRPFNNAYTYGGL